jgi:alpha-L-fucosidase
MKKYAFLTLLVFLFSVGSVCAQSDREPETDPVILNRLDEWQDLKFGFMMHWGIYAQWGIVESWNICNEPWIDRKGAAYDQYKHDYWNLIRTFNPTQFHPDQMAAAAKAAGMKYVVFTTKHHDGFCMFNSNETEYGCAGPECPYSKNAQPDITKSIVDAFRAKGLWTGLYFSKADWHNDDYWAHEWATPDRNVNYDINEHPNRWDSFKTFTHKQVYELTHNYGDIDILWLDGGWIRPEWSINDETRPWLGCYQRVQDIDMDKLVSIARSGNPDLIVVDRSVGGRYENYRTPEKEVPDSLLSYPWETCMTMGDSWSFVPNDNYKSTTQLIHILCDVVAKGGNLLLNVGPDAQGRLPVEALSRMKEMGAWLDINGKAIYSTRPLYPYSKGGIRYTQSKDGSRRYAICLIAEPTKKASFDFPFDVKKVTPLAGKSVKATVKQGKDRTTLSLSSSSPMYHAVVVEF